MDNKENTGARTVLVTGASSGIGAATARLLRGAGWEVYAGARRIEAMEQLRAIGCHVLPLDMTEEASLESVVRTIEAEQSGVLYALVNNAGIAEPGAVEEVSMERWRHQFEVNVFGIVRLCQLVLPNMRTRKCGRIVNVSSMGGEFTSPLVGAYHASKYALESVSDALRFEVAPFGVWVSVIQPGAVDTPIIGNAERYLPPQSSPYRTMSEAFVANWGAILEHREAILPPEEVAQAIHDVLEADEPPTRIKVGAMAEQMTAARRAATDAEWDANLRGQYGF